MNIILIGSFPTSITLYQEIAQLGFLQAVCFQEVDHEDEVGQYWRAGIQSTGIPTFMLSKTSIYSDFEDFLLRLKPDLVLVCGLGIKIPSMLLTIPTYGFLNIHFGQLPHNRGADPVFWTLKMGNTQSYITIHKIDENWDSGPVLIEYKVPVVFGETYNMLYTKLSLQLGSLVEVIIKRVQDSALFVTQSKSFIRYNPKPSNETITIDWEHQSTLEVMQLVNACNSKYGGALTYYQGGVTKIIEVNVVPKEQQNDQIKPGTVVNADMEKGLQVQCMDGQRLQIMIMNSDAGILSGMKYVKLGIRVGDEFTTRAIN